MGAMIELMFYSVKGVLCGETLSYIPHYALVSSCRRTEVTDATKMGVATARLPGRWELKACDVTSTIAGLRRLASQLGSSGVGAVVSLDSHAADACGATGPRSRAGGAGGFVTRNRTLPSALITDRMMNPST